MNTITHILGAGIVLVALQPIALTGNAQTITRQGQISFADGSAAPRSLKLDAEGRLQVPLPADASPTPSSLRTDGGALTGPGATNVLQTQAAATGQVIPPIIPPIYANPSEVQLLIDRRGTVFPPLPAR